MKNITFDQSSVLKEFAKIAYDKGLIKQAQEVPQAKGDVVQPPAPQSLPGGDIPQSGVGQLHEYDIKFNTLLNQYKDLASVVKNMAPPGGLQGLYNDSQAFFPALKKAVGPGYARLAPPVINALRLYFQSNLNPQQAKQVGEYLTRLMPAQKADDMESEAAVKNETVKQSGRPPASEKSTSKSYDVSGETGEDLVDQAHPGGGTYTEVSHSKTKENLVETVVEQQKRDIEVALKTPKGTYAALIKLRDNLVAMGHSDKLAELNNLISKMATLDEVVGHTLITLADKLDNMGYNKAANTVDELLKKKVIKAEYGEEIPLEPIPPSSPNVPPGRRRMFTVGLESEPVQELPLEPIPTENKVSKWQRYYNNAIKGSGLPLLKVDGIKGPRTSEALSAVQTAGVKNLDEFGQLARNMKAKSLTELVAQLQRPEQFAGQKAPESSRMEAVPMMGTGRGPGA